jgi:hypothetical protein
MVPNHTNATIINKQRSNCYSTPNFSWFIQFILTCYQNDAAKAYQLNITSIKAASSLSLSASIPKVEWGKVACMLCPTLDHDVAVSIIVDDQWHLFVHELGHDYQHYRLLLSTTHIPSSSPSMAASSKNEWMRLVHPLAKYRDPTQARLEPILVGVSASSLSSVSLSSFILICGGYYYPATMNLTKNTKLDILSP